MFSQATQLITFSFLLVMGSFFFFTGVTSIKYPGVVLDEKWKWKMHVNTLLHEILATL